MMKRMQAIVLALACVLAIGALAATETYDDIAGAAQSATAGFWTLTDHAGVSVEVATATVSLSSVGDYSASGVAFGDESDLFIPYSCFSLWSLARPLNSCPPTGFLLFFR